MVSSISTFRRLAIFFGFALSINIFCSSAFADRPSVAGQFIMKFASQQNTSSARTQRTYVQAALGVKVLKHNSLTNSDLVEANAGLNNSYAKELLAQGVVEFIEPNYIVHSSAVPNDTSFSQLWGMNNTGQTSGTADVDIDAPQAWDLTTGSNTVVVGVVDTGINYNHADLQANMWVNPGEVANNGVDDDGNGVIDDIHGFNAINSSGNPNDDNGHGSHCSGTIAGRGNNNLGVAGVNWQTKLMGLKFLDGSGSGDIAGAISAIEYAVNMKNRGVNIRVLSNSWGGGGYSQALETAITQANQAGILFTAAAGNDNNNNDLNPTYPAGYEVANVMSIAAIDHNGNRAYFSSFGETTVDLGAPGVDILSTSLGQGYATLSGTSMATPHVSGVAALVLSREPGLTVTALKDRLINTIKPLAQLTYQMRAPGIVSASRALTNQLTPLPPQPEEVTYSKSTEAFGYDANLGTLLSSADDEYKLVTLPFNFRYYGQQTNRIAISTNGRAVPLLDSQSLPADADYANQMRAGILVYHDDLLASPYSAQGGVWYKTEGNKAIVTWVSINYGLRTENNSAGEIRFQMHLYADGKIAFHYQDTDTGHVELNYGASASIGIAHIIGTSGETVTVSDNASNQNEVGNGKAVSFKVASTRAYSDFDGDGTSDLVAFRPTTGHWFILPSASKFTFSTYRTYQLGLPGDLPLIGDFDGDAVSDMAVWRPRTGDWFYRLSSENYVKYYQVQWGLAGDKPIAGDYDGDGRTDFTVYRPRSGQFFTLKSSSGYNRAAALKGNAAALAVINLGSIDNDPVVGRFTNTGQDEYATVWQVARFWTVKNINNQMLFSLPWGNPGDLIFSADRDGDKLSDRVVARKVGSSWKWYTSLAAGGSTVETFGSSTEIPQCSRDFDGDGKVDPATFHNPTGMWRILLSASAKTVSYQFGLPGDLQP